MSSTAEKLRSRYVKTVTVEVDGEPMPFQIRKLGLAEYKGRVSPLITAVLARSEKGEQDIDKEKIKITLDTEEGVDDWMDISRWAIGQACIDPKVVDEIVPEDPTKVSFSMLGDLATIDLFKKIMQHSGVFASAEEAPTVAPFSNGDGVAASSPVTDPQ